MTKIFQAGVISACLQSIFVIVITYTFIFLAWRVTSETKLSVSVLNNLNFAVWMETHSVILRYSYFLTAIGLILTRNRFVDLTARNILHLSHLTRPFTTSRELEVIFNQLLIATICFGIATLQSPPSILRTISNLSGSSWIHTVLWSGAMSIALAYYGATAMAAKKAM